MRDNLINKRWVRKPCDGVTSTAVAFTDEIASNAAAAWLVIPVTICTQNSRFASLRSDGAPVDFIGDRPANSLTHPYGLPVIHFLIKVLQRTVESAQFRSRKVQRALANYAMVRSMG